MNWFNFWFYLLMAVSIVCMVVLTISVVVLIWKMVPA